MKRNVGVHNLISRTTPACFHGDWWRRLLVYSFQNWKISAEVYDKKVQKNVSYSFLNYCGTFHGKGGVEFESVHNPTLPKYFTDVPFQLSL